MADSAEAFYEAIGACVYSGKVVAMSFLSGRGQGAFLREEFHNNRIKLVASQIFGMDPSLAYRWNRARLETTIKRLQAEGRLRLKGLVTHLVPFDRAEEAYELLDKHPEEVAMVALDFTA